MPKIVPKSRFRNRKINYKTRIAVRSGSYDFGGEELIDYADVGDDLQGPQHKKVELGVDKEEEHELHLQNVISASAARFAGRTGRAAAQAKPVEAHIPTPDATGVVANWEELYRINNYVEPTTYIRFSDTVEDVVGIAYTMDEEDEDWLEDYNANVLRSRQQDQFSDASSRAKSPRKAKEAAMPLEPLTEDDFELIMDWFEKATEEKVPFLHVDVSRIPAFSDFERAFASSPNNPRLNFLRTSASFVYNHWKERRLRRNGKSIMAQLDYDESQEDNPYVCFRRREPKNVRKTRRSDQQNLDRLLRLSSDLSSARDMMIKVLERERCKRDNLIAEHQVFEGRAQVRELKRRLGEKDGDENILIGKREKRRKPNEEPVPAPGVVAQPAPSLKVPLRFPRPDTTNTVPATPAIAEPIQPYKDRTQSIMQRIDRDMAKKREMDRDFEDYTDGAYLPSPLPVPAKYWRAPDSINLFSMDGLNRTEADAFGQAYPYALGGVRPSFRRRIGRGGRVYLDRTTARPYLFDQDEDEDDLSPDEAERLARLQDRWRFDSDASDLAGANSELVVDDFDVKYKLARIELLRSNDMMSLRPSKVFVDEVQQWLARPADPKPPIQVVGKLAVKAMHPGPPVQSISLQQQQQQQAILAAQAQAQAQAQQAQAQSQGTPVTTQAQLQAAHRQRTGSVFNGTANSPVPQLRRMPSGGLHSGLGANGLSLTPQQQNALAQWQNGMLNATKLDPALLQQLAQQQAQPGSPVANSLHLQRPVMPSNSFSMMVNGVATPIPAGANGMPATSRLATNAFSSATSQAAIGNTPTSAPQIETPVLQMLTPSRTGTPTEQPVSPATRSSRRSPNLQNQLLQKVSLPTPPPNSAFSSTPLQAHS